MDYGLDIVDFCLHTCIFSPKEREQYGHLTLPHNHPYCLQLKRVGMRLLQANKDIPQLYNKQWTISVIDLDIINCEVLPVSCKTGLEQGGEECTV